MRVDFLSDPAAIGLAAGGLPWERRDWLVATRDLVPGMAPLVAVRATDGDDSVTLPLGADGRAWASWYALRAGPIGSDRTDLLEAIARALRGRFAHLTLAPLDPDIAARLSRAFKAVGWSTHESEATANWVAHTAGLDFASYWAARPSRLRNTFRRKSRDAALAVTIHDRFDAAAWGDYEAVYAKSWKGDEGSPAFLRWMAETAAAEGRLRLGLLHDGVRPVAAQLWTVDGATATIHKLAYDEADRARSPGTILGHAMFACVFDKDRPAIIDYGTGDEPYKADWMDERRSLRRLELFDPRTPGGLIRGLKARLTR